MISFYFLNYIKKKLTRGLKKTGGRNIQGRICIFGQGGGTKILYKYIDLYRRINQFGKVLKVLKDLNRTAKIALVLYGNGLISYLILQKEIKVNSVIYSGTLYSKEIKIIDKGYSLPLKYMPLYSILSNIEIKPYGGGLLSRASDVSSLLISKNNKNATLKLNSGWILSLNIECMSSMGSISSRYNRDLIIGKAGKNRGLGWKPKVRGVAKNPCDHPHGGGNGKKSKPRVPTNAWASVFKWKHTTNKKEDKLNRRNFKIVQK